MLEVLSSHATCITMRLSPNPPQAAAASSPTAASSHGTEGEAYEFETASERKERIHQAKLGSLLSSQRASANEAHGEYKKGQMSSEGALMSGTGSEDKRRSCMGCLPRQGFSWFPDGLV